MKNTNSAKVENQAVSQIAATSAPPRRTTPPPLAKEPPVSM
jgi:hypothetical protein